MADVSDTASLLANEYTGIRGYSMEIPYWTNRHLEITAHRVKRRNNKITLMVAPEFRDMELAKHCDGEEWFCMDWWFIDLPF